MHKLLIATGGVILLAAAPTAAAAHTVVPPIHGGTSAGPAEPLVVIVMENKGYGAIVGNTTDAPYIQSMIAKGTLFTNYQAAPGSLPDYLRMTGGITTAAAAAGSNNLFHQLQTVGVSWGEYEESMPSACYTNTGSAPYNKGHNPAVWYHDITSKPAVCANVLPYSAFNPTWLRAFSYIVPNDQDNMHDGVSKTAKIKAGDAWLKAHVPAMLAGGAEVIVTWDEATRTNEHVATLAVGGTARKGAKAAGAYTHYGLLAGLEDAFGVPRLNAAKTATPIHLT